MRNIRRAIASSRRVSEFYSMRQRRKQEKTKQSKEICPVCECTPCDCHWGDQ
jgi:hypothetical protein